MYHEVWQNKFKDIIDLSQGKLIVDQSPAARRKLALSINDNVFKKLTFPLPQLIEFYKNNEADFRLSTIHSY